MEAVHSSVPSGLLLLIVFTEPLHARYRYVFSPTSSHLWKFGEIWDICDVARNTRQQYIKYFYQTGHVRNTCKQTSLKNMSKKHDDSFKYYFLVTSDPPFRWAVTVSEQQMAAETERTSTLKAPARWSDDMSWCTDITASSRRRRCTGEGGLCMVLQLLWCYCRWVFLMSGVRT